ncbi:MAG: hypothetical protein J6S14_11735 [Clostridia bacterium]|nr:hypothetical protein [Clostridia bacterium]
MTNRIKAQMLERLNSQEIFAVEAEAALKVLLMLREHPDLLPTENENAAPFAPIPEPAPQEKPITIDVLRAKIVEKRDAKGLNVKQFLNEHGYQKLSDVPESAFASLYKEVCDA